MFEDYKIAVLNFYREQHEKRLLSTDLENPNREKIRKECVKVFLRKNSKKDQDFVQSFFDPQKKYSDLVRSIEKFKLDKFRPLVGFLTTDKDVRDDNNVKLLAWLLNFPEYENWRNEVLVGGDESSNPDQKNDKGTLKEEDKGQQDGGGKDDGDTLKEEDKEKQDDEEKDGGEAEDQQEDKGKNDGKTSEGGDGDSQNGGVDNDGRTSQGNGENSETGEGKNDDKTSNGVAGHQQNCGGNNDGGNLQGRKKRPKPPVSVLFKVACSFIILFVASISYWFWKNNADKAIHSAKSTEQCMYWTGQHYEPINCDNNDLDKLKIPLNQEQLENQQRITMPDTLTNHALGKVWYGKVNGSTDKTPQFYTDSGTNPLDTTRRLLPVTTYMLNKYVSYERHLLNTLVWTVSLVVLFSLLITLAYKTRPKSASIKQQ